MITHPNSPDSVSHQLCEVFRSADPNGERLSRVFRESFDQAYLGQVTGRFSLAQLSKTERAHIGSIVEINIQREFTDIISDGEEMDYDIAGFDVDCKYSMHPFGWMIPTEAIGHFGMLCHADDELGTWRVGFIYFDETILNSGKNKDSKRTISASSRDQIVWLALDSPLPPNVLLQLDLSSRERILNQESGQARLDMLFRIAQRIRIPRGTVATVARQKDYMKRLRYNGGSRSNLQPEGIVILGDYRRHQEIARRLNLPIPKEGDSVSVRLFPLQAGESDPFFEVDGVKWRIAHETDAIVKAPTI